MNFIKEKTKDFYLLDSRVENIFINEYMPGAPGDYVKVFLYSLMYAEHGLEMSNEVMSKQLGISIQKINEAWNYWEAAGAIKKHFIDGQGNVDFVVEFLNLKELLYGKNTAPVRGETPEDGRDNVFGNDVIRQMFGKIEMMFGRALNSTEINMVINWVSSDGITPEVVLFAIKYCIEKDKTSMRYIEKVVHEWDRRGFRTVDQINDSLQETDERYYRYKRVMKALGFTRNASEAEREMMDEWFDEMGFTMERVLDACSQTAGISNPNFKYVNKVLENWRNKAVENGNNVNEKPLVTQNVLNRYYDYLREKAENEAETRKKEIYRRIPRIAEIDSEAGKVSSELSKALIMGISEDEMKKIRNNMNRLAEERAVILTENNYEMDYTDIKYACAKCNDTGITDLGERCSCYKTRMGEAEVWLKETNLKK